MERLSGGQSVVRSEFLSVAPALQNIRRRSLTPITLERGWIIMETPATTSSSSVDPTSSTATSKGTSSATPQSSGADSSARATTSRTSPSVSSRLQRSRDNDSPRAVGASLSVSTPTVTVKQPPVQTSSLTYGGAAASASLVSGPQKLGATSPQLGRRQGGSPTPQRARVTATEAAAPASLKPQAHMGGQQRPAGAEAPSTILTKKTPGEEGDGGVRIPAAPHGQESDTITRNQAHLEETRLLEAGQKPGG